MSLIARARIRYARVLRLYYNVRYGPKWHSSSPDRRTRRRHKLFAYMRLCTRGVRFRSRLINNEGTTYITQVPGTHYAHNMYTCAKKNSLILFMYTMVFVRVTLYRASSEDAAETECKVASARASCGQPRRPSGKFSAAETYDIAPTRLAVLYY